MNIRLTTISFVYSPEVMEEAVLVGKITRSAAVILIAPDTLPYCTKQG